VTERPSPCHVLVERAAKEPAAATSGEIRAFAKCRNERLRLPAFLKHYRTLGVDRFFIVDNDSSDGTCEYLAGQPDVRVFRTAARFREARGGTEWLNALLAEFGAGGWCVTVDIDELLVYPGSEQVPLRTLTNYLDQRGVEALACMMLDMYPDGPLNATAYVAGDDPLAAAPYFDAGPYVRRRVDLCPGILIRGGMRERVFYPEFRSRGIAARLFDTMVYRVVLRMPVLKNLRQAQVLRRPTPPCLTKVPVVRWDDRSKYLQSTHWVSPKAVAQITGALLHVKFLGDFHDRAVDDATRGEGYDGSSEYIRYARKLDEDPNLPFVYDGSTRFEGTAQLVRMGLMRDTPDWAASRRSTTA
jgi:hypothetical protein